MEFLQSISRVFPPPRYITLPNVAIDISETAVKYMSLSQKGDMYVPCVWGSVPVPEGVVSRGVVSNSQALQDILKKIHTDTGYSYVRLSLPEEQAYLFETTIQKDVSEHDVRNALEFKLEENVPLSPKNAFFDYDISEDDTGENLRVGVSVYAQQVVAGYREVCHGAGLIPISFEIESQAVARAVLPPQNTQTYMLIDFGKTRTGVGIVHNGVLMYTSTIEIGSVHIDAAIVEGMKKELTPEELIALKNTHGLTDTGDAEDIHTHIAQTMQDLIKELTVRVGYWKTHALHDEKRDIDAVVVCGGNANMRGIDDYFSEELGITTSRAEVWQNALHLEKYIPDITCQESYGYATAIGLALRNYMRV